MHCLLWWWYGFRCSTSFSSCTLSEIDEPLNFYYNFSVHSKSRVVKKSFIVVYLYLIHDMPPPPPQLPSRSALLVYSIHPAARSVLLTTPHEEPHWIVTPYSSPSSSTSPSTIHSNFFCSLKQQQLKQVVGGNGSEEGIQSTTESDDIIFFVLYPARDSPHTPAVVARISPVYSLNMWSSIEMSGWVARRRIYRV